VIADAVTIAISSDLGHGKESIMIAAGPRMPKQGLGGLASSAQDAASEMVRSGPALSMLALFGIGVGVGVLLAEVIVAAARLPR